MHATAPLFRPAGAAYLVIIAAGLFAELGVRMPLTVAGDPAATWANVAANLPLFRLGLAADAVMILADVALAVLLYAIFRATQPQVALAAMALRLVQAAIIGASLLASLAAVLLVARGTPAPDTLALLMELHAQGYDFGLIFFGANTLLTAWLACRSGLFPAWLAALLGGAGIVYLVGSFTALLAPWINAMIQPAYGLPVIAETAFALMLLRGARQAAVPT
ncbi:MAG: DUF4386 domain-containing protein [Paracoccaceae bacterium]